MIFGTHYGEAVDVAIAKRRRRGVHLRLTKSQRRAVRNKMWSDLYDSGLMTLQDIADDAGVHKTTVLRALARRKAQAQRLGGGDVA